MIDSVDGACAAGDGSTKPIADVEIGDEVLSSDPKTGEVSVELVTALPRTGNENNKLDRDMVDVSVDVDADGEADDTIETTAGHEFWVNLTEASNDGAKWAPARDLASGAWLRTSSGTWVQTTTIATETRLVNTYNLTVADTHTYYIQVAATDVLVHNVGECPVTGIRHGKIGEAATLDRLQSSGYTDIVSEVSFRSSDGNVFRADFVAKNPSGAWVVIEAKTGVKPTVTENQAFGYPELTSIGSILLSDVPGLTRGSNVVIPNMEIDKWDCPFCM